jgi:hypothetical protein
MNLFQITCLCSNGGVDILNNYLKTVTPPGAKPNIGGHQHIGKTNMEDQHVSKPMVTTHASPIKC